MGGPGPGPSEEYPGPNEEYFFGPPVGLGEEPVPYDDYHHHHHHHQPSTSTAVSTTNTETHRAEPLEPQSQVQELDGIQRDEQGEEQGEGQGSGLPSFLESEQQEERRARARAASRSDVYACALRGTRGKEREASAGRSVGAGEGAGVSTGEAGVCIGEGAGTRGQDAAGGEGETEEWSDDGEMGVGREGLGGELATWIEVCQNPLLHLSEAKQLMTFFFLSIV